MTSRSVPHTVPKQLRLEEKTGIAGDLFPGSMADIMWGMLPFIALLAVGLAIMMLFPQLSTRLPSLMNP